MNRVTPFHPARAARPNRRVSDHKGIHDIRPLPDTEFDGVWDSIIVAPDLKDRVLAQAVLNFTARPRLQQVHLPLHGIILFIGPPGTGKTSLARGLASRTAASLSGTFTFIEIDPHALASAAHGKTQQAVSHLLGTVLAEESSNGPCIVLLDEVETLAADRRKMSMEANPFDVHRATDAVLTQLDQLAAEYPQLLFIATSNFAGAIDEAFTSRADLVVTIELPTQEACKAILFDNTEPVFAAYQNNLPPLRALVHVSRPGAYPHVIRTPGEATDVALAVQDGMRSARREYGNIGTAHLFMAVPAGLAMLIGQLLNTFGSVQTYEHVTLDGSGQYRPAALLRPNL